MEGRRIGVSGNGIFSEFVNLQSFITLVPLLLVTVTVMANQLKSPLEVSVAVMGLGLEVTDCRDLPYD